VKTASKTFIALTALLAATAVSAADIDGKWVGMVGQSSITFEFKAMGNKLTGTLDNSAAPGATEIQEGKIDGDTISFHVMRTLNDAETRVEWTGKLTGDELKLQRGAVAGNEVAEVVAKHPKEE
jgi:hypothetical protein